MAVSRHPIAAVVAVAVVVRVATALVSFLANPRGISSDEQVYLEAAYRAADGRGPETFQNGYGKVVYDSWWLLVKPLQFLAEGFGPTRLPGQLFIIVFGVLTALFTTLVALRVLPTHGAVIAGLIPALLPSQVLWSSLVLRDAPVWAALALVAWCLLVALRTTGYRLAFAVAGIVAGLLTLGWLRPQTLVAAAWALPFAVLIAPTAKRMPRVAGALVLTVVMPLVAGLGVAGYALVHRAAPLVAQTRAYQGLYADSSIVDEKEGKPGLVEPASSGEDPDFPRGGALGIVSKRLPQRQVDGRTYGVLADRYGRTQLVDDSPQSNLKHIPAGIAGSLLRPVPGEHASTVAVRLASAENVIWYVLYVMAAVGLWRCGWTTRRLLAFPLLVSALLVGQFALTQGNVGTAFRHRGQLLWALALFAALALPRKQLRSSQDASPSEE